MKGVLGRGHTVKEVLQIGHTMKGVLHVAMAPSTVSDHAFEC